LMEPGQMSGLLIYISTVMMHAPARLTPAIAPIRFLYHEYTCLNKSLGLRLAGMFTDSVGRDVMIPGRNGT
jgi:hypothetical protein